MISIDRRRNNGPQTSYQPIFDAQDDHPMPEAPQPSSPAPAAFFLQTRLIHSANGSSFYESGPCKVIVSVHGPRPLSSKASSQQGYSPTAILSVDFKYAPFAAKQRTGYLKSTRERAIGQLLVTALQSSILTKLYPKSEIAVNVIVLEEPENGELNTIAATITAASAAIADAGIECTDLVAGSVIKTLSDNEGQERALVIGYMPHREEVTMMYATGKADKAELDKMISEAIEQATMVNLVVNQVLLEH